MMDDFGAELVHEYGGETYATPNLDRLAETGMRFDNAYTPPLCTPTRVQLMTGQYPFRNGWPDGIWNMGKNHVAPNKLKLGNVFQQAGYQTAVAGKWQLARFHDRPRHIERSGFDVYSVWTYRFPLDQRSDTDAISSDLQKPFPSRYWNPGVWEKPSALESGGQLRRDVDGKFGPDLYNERLLGFIDRNADRPFLIYYPMNLPHRPFVNPPPADPANQTEGDKKKRFGAMVHYADELIGRIVDKLEARGLREETLILVTGDNGTTERIPPTEYANREIAGEKNKLTEAGTRVPMIVNWPGTVPAGTVSERLVDTGDILPTVTDAAGIELPSDYRLDGRSFLPVLEGRLGNPRKWVFVQLRNQWFVRSESYRLHKDGRFYDMTNRYAPLELEDPMSHTAAAAKRRLERALEKLEPSDDDDFVGAPVR